MEDPASEGQHKDGEKANNEREGKKNKEENNKNGWKTVTREKTKQKDKTERKTQIILTAWPAVAAHDEQGDEAVADIVKEGQGRDRDVLMQ